MHISEWQKLGCNGFLFVIPPAWLSGRGKAMKTVMSMVAVMVSMGAGPQAEDSEAVEILYTALHWWEHALRHLSHLQHINIKGRTQTLMPREYS